MNGRDMHRTEYEQCAQDVRQLAVSGWQAVYIFLSAIAVALAVVLAQLVSRPWQEHDGSTLGLAAVAAIIGITLTWALKQINRRFAWLQGIKYARMRSIERLLGIRNNIYVHILDHWPKEDAMTDWRALGEGEQWFLGAVRQQLRDLGPQPLARKVIARVAWLLMAGWSALFLSELAIVLWNITHVQDP